ncbi:MAG: tRNA (N(6)-L-threonylcarbamoyladenosine(37)-C(2))-methylthiotransferase [Nanoarchaeota archaeon]
MHPKFIYFETYGCTANQNNTEIMKGLVRQVGLELTNNTDIADLLVINTCIVKEPTEKKIERRISSLLKKYSKKPMIIAGCMPETRAGKLRKKNIYLLGTHHVKDIAKLIKKILENKYEEKEFLAENNEIKLGLPKIPRIDKIGITQIAEGCLGNCSFCITKLAKGKLFSYPEEKILENIKNDISAGCKEIWLTSQDNAAYGLPEKRKLPELLRKIFALKGRFQVRLGMMNPENVLPILSELIEIYRHKKMKKFLHLPLQSGSNKILKEMNRKYSAEDWLKIVNMFRKEIPELFLSTDIIVGFPSETEEDFEKSCNIVEKIKPDMLNISRFWSMKPAPASKLKQLPVKTIKSRAKYIQSLYMRR